MDTCFCRRWVEAGWLPAESVAVTPDGGHGQLDDRSVIDLDVTVGGSSGAQARTHCIWLLGRPQSGTLRVAEGFRGRGTYGVSARGAGKAGQLSRSSTGMNSWSAGCCTV